MKITGIRTQPYQIKMQRPIGDANNPVGYDLLTTNALWLDTDEGVSGIAMAGAPGGLLQALVDDILLGKDPRGVQGHWNNMVDYVFKGGNRGQATATIASLDVALWDLKARLNDEPLWIGRDAPADSEMAFGPGHIDDVAVFAGELTADEVRRLFEGAAAIEIAKPRSRGTASAKE